MAAASGTTTGPVASLELRTRRAQFQPQASTVDTRRRQAICVRRAFKKYGPKSNPNIILDGLNMTVPKGTMYENNKLISYPEANEIHVFNCKNNNIILHIRKTKYEFL